MARVPIIVLIVGVFVVAAVIYALQTSSHRPPPVPAGIDHGAACTWEQPPGAVFTKDERLGAMISIWAHVTVDNPDLGTAIENHQIMRLTDAAHILARDQGARAASRRRRAVAKLAASKLTRNPLVTAGARSHEIDVALRELGMTDACLNVFQTAIAERYELIMVHLDTTKFNWITMILERLIPILFPDLLAGSDACWDPVLSDTSVTNADVWPLVLKTKVTVDKPLTEVARNIDPQRWDECSDFWAPPPDSTHLVDWVGGSAVQASSPPEPGSDHPDKMLLHEEFHCGLPCGDANFSLLLCVDTVCAPPSSGGPVDCSTTDYFHVDYNLPLGNEGDCACQGGAAGVSCLPPCNVANSRWWLDTATIGSLTVTPCNDEGHVRARKDPSDPSHTIVSAEKTLHFDPGSFTNQLQWNLKHGGPAFKGYLKEMDDELGELACCWHDP